MELIYIYIYIYCEVESNFKTSIPLLKSGGPWRPSCANKHMKLYVKINPKTLPLTFQDHELLDAHCFKTCKNKNK